MADAYRSSYLLLPLEDVGNGMVLWEVHIAVEDHGLPKDGGNVLSILEGQRWNKVHHNLTGSQIEVTGKGLTMRDYPAE